MTARRRPVGRRLRAYLLKPPSIRQLFSPKSLRYQLLSRSLFILSGLLILIGVFQYALMSRFLYQNTASTIRTQLHTTPLQVWLNAGEPDPAHPFRRPQPFAFTMPSATVAFIDDSGTFYVLFQQPDGRVAPRLPISSYRAALNYGQTVRQYQIVTDNSGNRQLVVLTPVGPMNNPLGLIEVSVDVRGLQRIVLRQLSIFALLAIGALAAGILTFLPTLRRTLVPLSQMIRMVERVNAGNLDERVRLKQAQSEVELLASSFNAMLERLKVSFEAERLAKENMRQFVADASHELRTPLTSIQGFLEVLLRGAAANPEQLQKSLQTMHKESERLRKLVQDLLTVARLDREPTMDLERHRLDLLITDMEPQLRLLAADRLVQIELESVEVAFDSDKMQQVILNLFHNAVGYTDPISGEIQVSLHPKDEEWVTLSVHDNGIGIPKEHLSLIFERFHRVDTGRSRRHGGAGLGLAIAKSIVEGHGGTISCDSEVGVGTTFTVLLPRA